MPSPDWSPAPDGALEPRIGALRLMGISLKESRLQLGVVYPLSTLTLTETITLIDVQGHQGDWMP